MSNLKNSVKFAFKSSIPVMAGYIVIGIGFGMLLESKGYSFVWAGFMSLTIFAGSMQFVAIDLMSTGASLIVTAFMTLMINVRHIFYGITMLEEYKKTGAKKPYLIFALTDETYSLVCSPTLPSDVNKQSYYLFVSIFNQFYWVLGSVLGGILGSSLNFNTAGIDFAMTALFVIIFVEQWEKTKNHVPALSGLTISIACLLIFGADNFLIPSMTGITIALFAERGYNERKVNND